MKVTVCDVCLGIFKLYKPAKWRVESAGYLAYHVCVVHRNTLKGKPDEAILKVLTDAENAVRLS